MRAGKKLRKTGNTWGALDAASLRKSNDDIVKSLRKYTSHGVRLPQFSTVSPVFPVSSSFPLSLSQVTIQVPN